MDAIDDWIRNELEACDLGDERRTHRLGVLLDQLAAKPGASIPHACEDWAAIKAAYRFLDNPSVNEQLILAGHVQATRNRARATRGPLLVLHDTTEFSFRRDDVDAIGVIGSVPAGRPVDGRPRTKTLCGVLMHGSLVVTTAGVPLGLAAVKLWTRQKFKGTNALKRRINPTRIPIEEKESVRWVENLRQVDKHLQLPARCVHIGDRESDIFELFSEAERVSTRFLVRTCVDRRVEDGDSTIADAMELAERGMHVVKFVDSRGQSCVATLDVRWRRMTVLPPQGKASRYEPLMLTVIHAVEIEPPKGRPPVVWRLLTNLDVSSLEQATEKLDWYAMRWRIETFHKILKSGCRVEDAKLRSAERLANLIALQCIVAWRIFWMTMISRAKPDADPQLAFTQEEMAILDRFIQKSAPGRKARMLEYVIAVARLGGFIGRRGDGSPGNMVIWRGLTRLVDITLGYHSAKEDVGN